MLREKSIGHLVMPMAQLRDDIRDPGGSFLICAPCIRSRQIPPEALVDGAEVVAAARCIAEITTATNTLSY